MVYLLHSIQDSEDQRETRKKEQFGKLKDTNLYWRLVQKERAKEQIKAIKSEQRTRQAMSSTSKNVKVLTLSSFEMGISVQKLNR